MTHPLPEGVYEELRTDALEAAVAALTDLTPRWHEVEPADAPHVLARHVAASVERKLAGLRDPAERLALVNELLDRVAEPGERVRAHEQLVVLSREVAPGVHRLQRPVTPLSAAALLTNAPGAPSCGPSWSRPTASICCARSSAGTASACWPTSWPRCASAASRSE